MLWPEEAGAFAAGFAAGGGSCLWMRAGACFSQSVGMFPFRSCGFPLGGRVVDTTAQGVALLALEGLGVSLGGRA